jgi:hypothetical protein
MLSVVGCGIMGVVKSKSSFEGWVDPPWRRNPTLQMDLTQPTGNQTKKIAVWGNCTNPTATLFHPETMPAAGIVNESSKVQQPTGKVRGLEVSRHKLKKLITHVGVKLFCELSIQAAFLNQSLYIRQILKSPLCCHTGGQLKLNQ